MFRRRAATFVLLVAHIFPSALLSYAPMSSDFTGPSFLLEPPGKYEFSNTTGAWIDCTAAGNPAPHIRWLTADGTPVSDVPSLRQDMSNGTLALLPFTPAMYRQDVHSAVYRCLATNDVGAIVSRDVHVRAVVAQDFNLEVRVVNGGSAKGCTAVLECVTPTFMKDLVKVVSWLQEPGFYIYPSLQGDGKYHAMHTGELLVHNLESSDQFSSYTCQMMHTLTRKVTTSSPANIVVHEAAGNEMVEIVAHKNSVRVAQDEGAVLTCITIGCPHPHFRWYHVLDDNEPTLLETGSGTRVLGQVLSIEAVRPEDSGTYRCSASNDAGQTSADIKLDVVVPLRVQINPTSATVSLNGQTELRCMTSSSSDGPHSITWYKDGRVMAGRAQRDVLRLVSVSRSDCGIYQCLVRRGDGETAQSAATVRLGDAPPIMEYTFIEQTLQPGPTVSLKCSASGNPTPSMAWSLDGFKLPDHPRYLIGQYVTLHGDIVSHLNISQVSVEDGGEYTCTANNRAGTSSHSARLNIYGDPYVRPMNKITAVAGENMRIKCPVAGYPINEIRWEKDGKELPEDLRQKTDLQLGVLTVMSVQKGVDSGSYTCVANNKHGHSAKRTTTVDVIVPPVIEPFNFPGDGLVEGTRTRVVCGVSHGDPPLSIAWLKDGAPVLLQDEGEDLSAAATADNGVSGGGDGAVVVTTLDPYSSLLSIPRLTRHHTGRYTCQAQNPAAQVRYTAALLVKVPPKWTIEPADVDIERNRQLIIDCQADGVPKPTIVWKKATGSKSGDYEELKEKIHTKVLSNHSLLLQNVKEDKQGYYLCQASNGIGNAIGKVIQVNVKSSPLFSSMTRTVSTKEGDTATLQCNVTGDHPIEVKWFKNGKSDTMTTNKFRLTERQQTFGEKVIASLQINNVQVDDGGSYVCQASNVYGRDQQLVQLHVQEPPNRPNDLRVIAVTSTSINVQWDHNGDQTSKYIVQHKKSDGWWDPTEVIGNVRMALVTGLQPATRYLLRVIAAGDAGWSAPSEDLTAITNPERPSGPPTRVEVRSLSSTQLLVTWSPPQKDHRNGMVLGYNVGIEEASMELMAPNMTTVYGDGEDGGELILADLIKFKRYSVVVQAFNEVGNGPLSEPTTAQTMEDVPSSHPLDVHCLPLGSQTLQMSWKHPEPQHWNGVIQGYVVTYDSIDRDDDIEIGSRRTSSLTIVLTGLHKYTNYTLKVAAYTRIGTGENSESITCCTDQDAPGPPEDIKTAVSSAQSFTVAWSPPKYSNGVLLRYNLYTRVMNGEEELNHMKRTLPSHHLTYEAKGLQPHLEYQFWVTASTKIGEGQSSKVATQILSSSRTVPAKIVSFGGLIERPWRTYLRLPCVAVGQPAVQKQWLKSFRAIQSWDGNAQVTKNGDMTITSLHRSHSDNYTCHVENIHGADSIIYRIIVQVPPEPPILYTARATSSSLVFHWRLSSNGDAPITGYTMTYHVHPRGPYKQVTIPRHTTSYYLNGLTCGQTYQAHIIANNKIGSSTPSAAVTARTKGNKPGVPKKSLFMRPNSTYLRLNLEAWPDNDCPITKFVIRHRPMLQPHWTTSADNLRNQRKFTIIGLMPATEYQVQVEGHNAAGSTLADYYFFTLTENGEEPPPELVETSRISQPFYYMDMKTAIPVLGTCVVVLVVVCTAFVCLKRKRESVPQNTRDTHDRRSTENQKYYATIHKVGLTSSEKIPETSADISPYATFPIDETQHGSMPMLHNLTLRQQSIHENYASSSHPSKMFKNRHDRSSQDLYEKHSTHMDDSDSDVEQMTSSFIYSRAQSSTSSDLSPPPNDQKSLPRRTQTRWFPTNRSKRSSSMADTSLFPTANTRRAEIDNCNSDTLKKLNLGKSTLWSKPVSNNNPQKHSDYSIAV
ncbi:Down syndrome cell adhesion molecule-like protein Dscam2 isoform X3 [Sipha flava]|uniref:Down syndrome cell adhesion molecule-like protein Dscam2 isoform X3 n=1 Tax=Sipha flava TaxID=143950 RepID=A0A8B8GNR7_9HEMI|nr:Down syndrome cell adhesion molecule-like protein Dscam2 isoform X3 [Sipha flava]